MRNEFWDSMVPFLVLVAGVVVSFCWLATEIASCNKDGHAKKAECASQCAGNTECIRACGSMGGE